MSAQDAIVARHHRGEISAEIALAQILLAGTVPATGTLPPPLEALAEAHRERLDGLAALARAGFDVAGADALADTAALFDRLAATAPEAAVAFYSFGDPDVLAAATAELAGVIRDWAPVAGRAVLDFGCGIGRVAAALASDAAEVVGIDVSAGMIAEAERRAGERSNLRFLVSDGITVPLPTQSADVIVAADSTPFLVQAGGDAIDRAFVEFRRVLRPGGDILVFNWSYRGDVGGDVAEAQRLAERHGLELARAGERPFAIWDATGFHLRLPR